MYLFFDLDGVLADFCNLHKEAFIKAWDSLMIEYPIQNDFYNLYLDSLSTKQKIYLLINKLNISVSNEQISEIMNLKQHHTNVLLSASRVYNKTKEAIRWAKSENHILVCCSNGIKTTILKVIEKLEATTLFTLLLSNEDVNEAKPSPEIYLKAMEITKAKKEDILVFEDSVVGREAAIKAGLTYIPIIDALDMTPNFLEYCILNKVRPSQKKINIVIPMAGLGSRFQSKGYTISKPFLPVFGKPMFQWVIDNIVPPEIKLIATIHIIIRKEHETMLNELKEANVQIHTVEKLTEGAACTVLNIENYINNDYPLVIANSDQYLEWDAKSFYDILVHPDWDGVISSFIQNDSSDLRWSYANINDQGIVIKVAEKEYIGPLATTGIYGWKKGSDFVKDAHTMIAQNIRINNEFYVCPVYNTGIDNGLKFRTLNCKKMWGLGVPDDYEFFLQNFKTSLN